MNIFYLHSNSTIAARAMTNKHVVKMILESAQLLCTAHRVSDEAVEINGVKLYKSTHRNHPSAKWVRESMANYEWLYDHFLALSIEYYIRFGRLHLTYQTLGNVLGYSPINIDRKAPFTAPPCAMPEQYCIPSDAVNSYRRYYEAEKLKYDDDIARYKLILGV